MKSLQEKSLNYNSKWHGCAHVEEGRFAKNKNIRLAAGRHTMVKAMANVDVIMLEGRFGHTFALVWLCFAILVS